MVQPGSHQPPMPPLRRHRGDTAQRSLSFDSGPARTATSRAVSSGSSLVAAPGPLGRRASQLNQNLSGPNAPHAIVTSGRQRRDRVGVRGHDRRESVAPERHAAPSICRKWVEHQLHTEVLIGVHLSALRDVIRGSTLCALITGCQGSPISARAITRLLEIGRFGEEKRFDLIDRHGLLPAAGDRRSGCRPGSSVPGRLPLRRRLGAAATSSSPRREPRSPRVAPRRTERRNRTAALPSSSGQVVDYGASL
jgi:hypothetical protein